ncbi:MAG: NAD(P)H-dependent oxidoreductase [Oscillospiraceae bacterium]|nr:NAD(P)H-dependent oxidoreductase [Oscillospiraceae bacterium]
MRVIIHDTPIDLALGQDDISIFADGKYAPCQGCFGCWTKHPAECFLRDSLQKICQTIGNADELIIIAENCYGSYSPNVKNILDRSIGTSTPLSTYRGRQMHHSLRYGKHELLKVLVYGEVSEDEKSTFVLLAERNALNNGYSRSEVFFLKSLDELNGVEL